MIDGFYFIWFAIGVILSAMVTSIVWAEISEANIRSATAEANLRASNSEAELEELKETLRALGGDA